MHEGAKLGQPEKCLRYQTRCFAIKDATAGEMR